MRRLLLVVLFLCRLALADAAHAQAPLEPFGMRVRAARPPPDFAIVEGQLLDLTPTSLTLRQPAGTAVLHGVTTLGLYRGRVPHVGRGAAWGAVVGSGAGLLLGVVGAVATKDCYDAPFCDISPGTWVSVLTVLGASGGAALGSIVGLLGRTPRWDPVPTDQFYDRGIRIRVRPTAPEAATLEGVLAAPPSRDGLALTTDGRPTLVPLAAVREVAVYRGRGTRNILGTLLGAGAGAIAGTLVGATSENLEYIPMGVGAGTLAGFLVGSAIPRNHWEPVAMPRLRE
ncbi:MAG: hypothetical protein OER21_11430 [Gemmatimonadota bacterium]|nr:hypothetical protein [Gemmatimonadota bacterium]